MSVRAPQSFRRGLPEDPIAAALDHEVMGEKVATYVRLNDALAKALRRLARHDEKAAAGEQTVERNRDTLVDCAAKALWHVVVQRDLMRLPGTERYLRDMGVPREVRLRMGVMR